MARSNYAPRLVNNCVVLVKDKPPYKNTGEDLSDLAQRAMDKILEPHINRKPQEHTYDRVIMSAREWVNKAENGLLLNTYQGMHDYAKYYHTAMSVQEAKGEVEGWDDDDLLCAWNAAIGRLEDGSDSFDYSFAQWLARYKETVIPTHNTQEAKLIKAFKELALMKKEGRMPPPTMPSGMDNVGTLHKEDEYKIITGHSNKEEHAAYADGYNDHEKIMMAWIEKWDGSTNSALGDLLDKKFKCILQKKSIEQIQHKVMGFNEWFNISGLENGTSSDDTIKYYAQYYHTAMHAIEANWFWTYDNMVDAIMHGIHMEAGLEEVVDNHTWIAAYHKSLK